MGRTLGPQLAEQGLAAVRAQNYADGIEKLSQALKQRAAPLWYIERSKAYLRTKQFDLARYDAEMALHIAFDRANRHLMAEAQLRRAIAFFRMGRFADADICAFWCVRLSDGAKALENDGQPSKVDDNGDYTVQLKAVLAEPKPKQEGLWRREVNPALMNGGSEQQKKELLVRNQAVSWRIQALTQMEKLPVGHDGRKPHVLVKYPEPAEPSTTEEDNSSLITTTDDRAGGESSNTANVPSATSVRGAWEQIWWQYRDSYTQHKIRFAFYQTETSLTIDVFIKGLSSGQVSINTESQAVKITPVRGASLNGFSGPVVFFLFSKIKPEATKFNIKSMKVELVLQKKKAGKWPALRYDNADIVDNLALNSIASEATFSQFIDFMMALGYKDPSELQLPSFNEDASNWYTTFLDKLRSHMFKKLDSLNAPEIDAPTSTVSALPLHLKDSAEKVEGIESQENVAPKMNGSAPAYPTSSKTGPKNWDNIDDGDDEDPSTNGDVNGFFQQVYKGADDDTKRAMMKSFVESNGTALSTSWTDAKGKTYKTQPPDGVEAKKWE